MRVQPAGTGWGRGFRLSPLRLNRKERGCFGWGAQRSRKPKSLMRWLNLADCSGCQWKPTSQLHRCFRTGTSGRRTNGRDSCRPRKLYSCIAVCTIIVVALPDEPFCLSEHRRCSNKLSRLRFVVPCPQGQQDANAVLRMGNGQVKDWTSPAHDLIEIGLFPSLLSCVQLCPAPPVSTHTPLQLPC